MKISIDTVGEMRNTVKGFSDRYCFIDELVQNAERAGASKVWLVENSKERVVVRNNGAMLEDFSSVFTKSISGWAAQGNVDASRYAFGAGFFSVMVVADLVEVRSGRRGARFDVAGLLEDGRLECIEEFDLAAQVLGFEVILTKLKDIDVKKVEERFVEATRYFGEEGKKKKFHGLFEGRDTRFCKRVDIPGVCEGAIWVQEYGNVETWYENRKVDSNPHAGSGIGGKFFISGKISPRAPDRKEWIRDTAFLEWVSVLIHEGNKLMEKVVAEGGDALIDSLSWPIRCRVHDLRSKLRFVTLEEYQMEERSRKIRKEEKVVEESVIYKLAADAGLSVTKRDVAIQSFEPPSTKPSVVDARKGKRLCELRGTVAWIRVSDIDEKAAEIQELRENGVTIVVARNDMQAEALSDLDQVGVTKNILKRGATLSRRGALNEFEDALCALLRRLSSTLGCVPIELCDIDGWTENKTGGRKRGQNFLGLYYKEVGEEIVAVGRSALKEFDPALGAVKALAYVSDVVAEEVAHSRGYADGDILLEREKVQVMRAILDMVADIGGR